jgi:hypothetical protein
MALARSLRITCQERAVSEHRQSPRLEVVSLVQGTSEDGHAVTVLNISQGGALVHSTSLLSIDETHEFRFMSDESDPAALLFQARIAHVELPPPDQSSGCFAGLQFLEARTGRQALAVRRLIDLCTAPHRQSTLFPDNN